MKETAQEWERQRHVAINISEAASRRPSEEQPHTHAAIGGAEQRSEQQAPRQIVMPDVVPRIERGLGGIGQQHLTANASRPSGRANTPDRPGWACIGGAIDRPSHVARESRAQTPLQSLIELSEDCGTVRTP